MWIDTHTHLFLPEFKEDIQEVIDRATAANVRKMLLPNIHAASVKPLKHLCDRFSDCLIPMMGLHPCYVNESWETELETIREELEKNTNTYCAVGEIGIDLYWDKTYREQQKQVFQTQLKWAKQLHKPVAIHVRNAFDEVFEIIEKEIDENLKGVFHCFTGNKIQAERILSYQSFYFGIGGVVTFKNAGVDKVVKDIPLEKIVLETDSPYLAPVPYRGKRNESSFIPFIAKKLAEIKNVDIETVARQTTLNAQKLFNVS